MHKDLLLNIEYFKECHPAFKAKGSFSVNHLVAFICVLISLEFHFCAIKTLCAKLTEIWTTFQDDLYNKMQVDPFQLL